MITLSLIPGATPPTAKPGAPAQSTALDFQPAPGSVAPTAPSFAFPRTSRPTDDLEAVRAGIRNIAESAVVDLSVAHSLAAGNAVVLPIQGTAFMLDKGTDVGNALIHVQDQTLTPVNSINIFPGDAYDMPFTFIVIENAAQAGKVARIHYGTGISFKPSLAGTLTISGNVAITQTAAGAPTGVDKTISDGRMYFRRAAVAAGGAGQFSYFGVENPAASGKRVYLDGAHYRPAAAAEGVVTIVAAATLAQIAILGQNFLAGGAAEAAPVRHLAGSAAAVAGGELHVFDNTITTYQIREFFANGCPVIVEQGFAAVIWCKLANTAMDACLRHREY